MRALPVFTAIDDEHVVAVKDAAAYVPTAGAALTERVLVTLRQAASHHPFDEALQARLIEVLAAAGRQAEALETYQVVRARIADEIGLEPGPELREAQRGALGQSHRPQPAAPTTSTAEPAPVGTGAANQVYPAQLPRDLGAFTGRGAELDRLDSLVPAPSEPAQAVVLSGMAGVGKTTLAVHWANRLAPHFPDGQVYVDLRGFHLSGAAMSTAEALRALLDAFGVPVGDIPAALPAQATTYRSLLAGRRVLVVLDNARDSEQVRPLLPAPHGCLAVVTSRHQLQGLMAVEGAHSVTLSPLEKSEARGLLARGSAKSGSSARKTRPPRSSTSVSGCHWRWPS
ncbi:BTAD domain-containing putative transcriptional regulator [Streptomyces kaempferi]